MRKGIPVSPGVALAPALCLSASASTRGETDRFGTVEASVEVKRLDEACRATVAELDTVCDRVARELGSEAAAVFLGHSLLARDPALLAKVKAAIVDHGLAAETAL